MCEPLFWDGFSLNLQSLQRQRGRRQQLHKCRRALLPFIPPCCLSNRHTSTKLHNSGIKHLPFPFSRGFFYHVLFIKNKDINIGAIWEQESWEGLEWGKVRGIKERKNEMFLFHNPDQSCLFHRVNSTPQGQTLVHTHTRARSPTRCRLTTGEQAECRSEQRSWCF